MLRVPDHVYAKERAIAQQFIVVLDVEPRVLEPGDFAAQSFHVGAAGGEMNVRFASLSEPDPSWVGSGFVGDPGENETPGERHP